MAQTSSSQRAIINPRDALQDINTAENIFDVSALTAKILVGVATNSAASAQHLHTLASTWHNLGGTEKPVQVTFGDKPPVIHVEVHEKSVTVIKELLVAHIDVLQKRVSELETSHNDLRQKYLKHYHGNARRAQPKH